jgi:RimJ/RimL family protein N-acetyltransferase
LPSLWRYAAGGTKFLNRVLLPPGPGTATDLESWPDFGISLPLKELHVIRGERVYLRAIERDDLERCHDWMNDEELTATLAQRQPISLAREADWVERATRGQDPSELNFAICLAQGDRHIGNCGLVGVDRDNRTATLGIFIGEKDCRGQGFGEESVRALCRFAFDELDLRKIRLDVHAGNADAVKTYERVGFRREGVLREEQFRKGRPVDVLRMGLLRSELT